LRLYHFTSETHLPFIEQAGVLRVTDPNLFAEGPVSYLDPTTGQVEQVGPPIKGTPVVWLLDQQVTPRDRNGLGGSIVDKSKVRITVEVDDARRWLDWLTVRPHDARWVQTIIRTGGGLGAAKHWWVCPRPIPSSEWVDITHL
jgi:hypothetical protein